MGNFKVKVAETIMKIVQGVSELKRGDRSRVSGYSGKDKHAHTGSNSRTVFSKKK